MSLTTDRGTGGDRPGVPPTVPTPDVRPSTAVAARAGRIRTVVTFGIAAAGTAVGTAAVLALVRHRRDHHPAGPDAPGWPRVFG